MTARRGRDAAREGLDCVAVDIVFDFATACLARPHSIVLSMRGGANGLLH
jgi:hypothetical protein